MVDDRAAPSGPAPSVAAPRGREVHPDRRHPVGGPVGRGLRLQVLRALLLHRHRQRRLGQPNRPPAAPAHAQGGSRLPVGRRPSRRAAERAGVCRERRLPEREPGLLDPAFRRHLRVLHPRAQPVLAQLDPSRSAHPHCTAAVHLRVCHRRLRQGGRPRGAGHVVLGHDRHPLLPRRQTLRWDPAAGRPAAPHGGALPARPPQARCALDLGLVPRVRQRRAPLRFPQVVEHLPSRGQRQVLHRGRVGWRIPARRDGRRRLQLQPRLAQRLAPRRRPAFHEPLAARRSVP
mmetsp:Transcript_13032/g.42688  ORF Transcript_13032/g.42688 Transcript_13032/m.42688 type:complete len:289 (-) Transcript_13032:960-1826(-)